MRSSIYNKEFYTNIFKNMPEEYYRIQGIKIEKIISMLEDHKGGRILDIGCGDGFISKLMADRTGAEVHGIDISENSLKKAKKRGIKTRILDVDKDKMPYPKGFFDCVFCGDILEHVYDTEGLLKNINRILKNRGYLIVSVPNIASWYNRFFLLIGWMPTWIESSSITYTGNPFLKKGVGHIHAFTKRSLSDLLKINGFKIEEVSGSPVLADGTRSKKKETIWNKVDTLFSRRPSLSSIIIIKARKKKDL